MTVTQVQEIKKILASILPLLPEEFAANVDKLEFSNESGELLVPTPLKQTETISALKGLEALVAFKLAEERYGTVEGKCDIDLHHALLFLMSTYCSSIDGYYKTDKKEVLKYLKPTDLNEAQSDPYRRMSANLYRTKDKNRYYHIHGSLEASTCLKMIGLPPFIKGLTDYNKIVEIYQTKLDEFTVDELEALNNKNKQAGVEALKQEDFLATPHGKVISKLPPFEIEQLETTTPPIAFTPSNNHKILEGVKVLELCRIIAGPTIGKILAEYGATVIKVTSDDTLPDVPFFQLDANMGKHTTNLNLKNPEDRIIFENLLKDADVIIDGYRQGAIEKLGYGKDKLAELAISRNKGYIYGSENCFGFTGEWSHRPGWQQIADCASGVAWVQGLSFGKNEPMVPPFPMSDYGTGCLAAIAIMLGIYKRNKIGGSYWCSSSLVQYDLLLLKQGTYPEETWKSEVTQNEIYQDFMKIRYYDSVDKISKTAMQAMITKQPNLLNDEKYFVKEYSDAFKGMLSTLKPVCQFDNIETGYNCSSRPNGYDAPEWW
ncbi:Acetyl-coenzyme A transferase nodX [Candida tropicalis]|nr:CoA transferase [Asgard group archaeon]